MVIESNAADESRATTPNVEASNCFAVLFPDDNDGETLAIFAGSNRMDVEESSQNLSADQDNRVLEIVQHTSRQMPEHDLL